MNNSQQIRIELEAISPGLPFEPRTPYQVPAGYFEQLADVVMERIRENEMLSFLGGPDQTSPLEVPEGYFDSFAEAVLGRIRTAEQVDNPADELKRLSPLLAGISREMPYSVPAGYFDNVETGAFAEPAKETSPVVQMGSRRNWFRYAAAAIAIGVIMMSAFLFVRSRQTVDPAKNPDAWVAKNLKHVSNEEVQRFIQLTSEPATVGTKPVKTEESVDAHDLLKDVSTHAMENFVSLSDATDEEDILFN